MLDSPMKETDADREVCSIEGCAKPRHARGLCGSHYQRLRTTGSVQADRELRASRTLTWIRANAFADTDECIVWPFSLGSNGYGQAHVFGRPINAHRYVCELTNGQPEIGMEAAHSCGNKACVNSRHLRWATPKENAEDRKLHGTHYEGEDCGAAKLTNAQAATIRRDRRKQRDIAREYGVTQKVICLIKQGKSYREALSR